MTEEMYCRLFLVLLISPLSVSETKLVKNFFHVDTRYSDILPSEALLWTRNGSFSLSRCAIMCVTDSMCLSFFVNNVSCHGYRYRMDDLRKRRSARVLGMVYAEPKGMLGNLALLKPTIQGSYRPANDGNLTSEYAVDGQRWPGIINPLCSISNSADTTPFWQVDLQQAYVVHAVAILIIETNPISSIKIEIANIFGGKVECISNPGPSSNGRTFRELPCNAPTLGQIVWISKTEKYLTLCEVEVYGTYP